MFINEKVKLWYNPQRNLIQELAAAVYSMDPETGYGLPISEIYNWCSLLILEFYWLNFCVSPLAWYSNPMRALITDQNSMQKMKRINIGMEEYTAVADYKKSCLNSIRQNNNVLISSKLYIYI